MRPCKTRRTSTRTLLCSRRPSHGIFPRGMIHAMQYCIRCRYQSQPVPNWTQVCAGASFILFGNKVALPSIPSRHTSLITVDDLVCLYPSPRTRYGNGGLCIARLTQQVNFYQRRDNESDGSSRHSSPRHSDFVQFVLVDDRSHFLPAFFRLSCNLSSGIRMP